MRHAVAPGSSWLRLRVRERGGSWKFFLLQPDCKCASLQRRPDASGVAVFKSQSSSVARPVEANALNESQRKTSLLRLRVLCVRETSRLRLHTG